MGIFDIFKKKETISNESKSTSNVEEDIIIDLFNGNNNPTSGSCEFVYYTHQRFEHGVPRPEQLDINRTIRIEKNISGNIGYSISIRDGETDRVTLAPKPMKIIEHTSDKVVLKGYGYDAFAVAMGAPMEIASFECYAISLFLKDDVVYKCISHWLDRDINIVYYNKNVVYNKLPNKIIQNIHEYNTKVCKNGNADNSKSNGQQSSTSTIDITNIPVNITYIISLAKVGLQCAVKQEEQEAMRNLLELYNVVKNAPSQLLDIPDEHCESVSSAYGFLLVNRFRNNDDRIAVANYAFYLISRAIRYKPTPKLYQKRLMLVVYSHEFFFYTVAKALNVPDTNPLSMVLRSPLIVRTNEYIYPMIKYDFEHAEFQSLSEELQSYYDICYKLNNSSEDGKGYIDETMKYLERSFQNINNE